MSESSGTTIEQRLAAASKGVWTAEHSGAAIGYDDMLVSPIYDVVRTGSGIDRVRFHGVIALQRITLNGTGASGFIYVPESLPDDHIDLGTGNKVAVIRDPWRGLANFAKLR